MELDYMEIGRRIAHRRRELHLKQYQVEERANLSYKYLSIIERGLSIPSTEIIMRIAIALKTTPDEFLTGASHRENDAWRDVEDLLRPMDEKQLSLARNFLNWLREQKL